MASSGIYNTRTNLHGKSMIETGLITANTSINLSVIKGTATDIEVAVFDACGGNQVGCFNGDAATNVVVTDGDITLAWGAPATGDAPTGYEVFWGETSGSLTSLGTLSATTVNITNVAYSTTYYWMIVPENIGGSATGCVEWSFTTEDAPPAPANDLPAGAIALTLDEGTACGANIITGISNLSTTDSGISPLFNFFRNGLAKK